MTRPLVLLILIAAGCGRSVASDASTQPNAPAVAAAGLDVVPITSQKLDKTIRLPGEITAFESVALHPRVSAFVAGVLVDRGARVKRGQLLVRLSAPELGAQRAEAEAKAGADWQTFVRLRAAAATPGAVSKQDVEIAGAAARASAARARSLRALESYLIVSAPFDGVVTERNVHPGALVGPSNGAMAVPMLRMDKVATLRLTVAVPEADAGAIADGAKAEFTVPAWPGEVFTGVIRRVSHALDARTRSMPVEMDVDNRAGRLAPGMLAEVRWPVRRAAPSLVVPASAIVQTPDRTYVDRVRDGVVEQVVVRRGLALGDRAEVFGSVAAGDLVLRRGSEEMKSGARVVTKLFAPDGGVAH